MVTPAQIRIKEAHSKEWEEYKQRILEIEEIFDPKLREEPETIKAFFDDPQAIVLVAEIGTNVVGCLYAAPIESNLFLRGLGPTKEYKTFSDFLKRDSNFGKCNTMYESSLAVLSRYEGRGIGTALDRELARVAKDDGYKFITAHNAPDASLHIAEKLGWKKVEECKNWFGTGEDYCYMRLEL